MTSPAELRIRDALAKLAARPGDPPPIETHDAAPVVQEDPAFASLDEKIGARLDEMGRMVNERMTALEKEMLARVDAAIARLAAEVPTKPL